MTYWSRDLGPYVWHDFDAERVRADVQGMAAARFRIVRTLLPWDVFMPRIDPVPSACLRNFETLLRAAEETSISVIPVLFAQSLGDCIFLPPYAIDVSAARRGVRVVTDGVLQPGGPRDQYTDSRMQDAAALWLDSMLDAFAGNPGIACWDLGHDPASTLRPRRIDDLRRWTATFASRLHDRGERCMVTLGAADITRGRGVRLDAVSESVDALGVLVEPQDLWFRTQAFDARAVAFLSQLAQRLAGPDIPLHVNTTAERRETGEETTSQQRRFGGDAVAALIEAGCAGVHATAWSDCAERLANTAPFDLHSALMRHGVIDVTDEATAFGDGWIRAITAEQKRRTPRAWPDSIDVADYYANLPHSIDDLFAAWAGVANDHPAMLD